MRFIHTSDWHLGRIFHGVHLTEDQAYVLEIFFDLIKETQAEAVLISGDIYDRAVPPPEAVKLLDDFLSRVVLGLNIKIIMITGNHDSPSRMGFGSRLLAAQGLNIISSISPKPFPIILQDQYGPLHAYAIPYAEPAVARECLGVEKISDHQAATSCWCDLVRESLPPGMRTICLAHAFVSGGEESESERPLSVGGAGTVEISTFMGFHYVALGHLHRPQSNGPDNVHYAGSLLKYSFSEASHIKSVNLVEMDAEGVKKVDRVRLTPRFDVRCIQGELNDILQRTADQSCSQDYLKVTLLDREPLLDAMGKLRQIYPNVLQIERPHLFESGEIQGSGNDHRRCNDLDLFQAFYNQMTGDSLTAEQAKAYGDVVENHRKAEREAGV